MVLAPDTVRVAPGETFSLDVRVDVAGKRFNAYDAIVAFDTTALKFETPARARDAEGPLMTGACGNTFHRVTARGDSVIISHVILCGGIALNGPGTLHHLRFEALSEGTTPVTLRHVQFYDAGLYADPSRTRDAIVIVSASKPPETATGARLPLITPATNSSTNAADCCAAPGRCQG